MKFFLLFSATLAMLLCTHVKLASAKSLIWSGGVYRYFDAYQSCSIKIEALLRGEFESYSCNDVSHFSEYRKEPTPLDEELRRSIPSACAYNTSTRILCYSNLKMFTYEVPYYLDAVYLKQPRWLTGTVDLVFSGRNEPLSVQNGSLYSMDTGLFFPLKIYNSDINDRVKFYSICTQQTNNNWFAMFAQGSIYAVSNTTRISMLSISDKMDLFGSCTKLNDTIIVYGYLNKSVSILSLVYSDKLVYRPLNTIQSSSLAPPFLIATEITLIENVLVVYDMFMQAFYLYDIIREGWTIDSTRMVPFISTDLSTDSQNASQVGLIVAVVLLSAGILSFIIWRAVLWYKRKHLDKALGDFNRGSLGNWNDHSDSTTDYGARRTDEDLNSWRHESGGSASEFGRDPTWFLAYKRGAHDSTQTETHH